MCEERDSLSSISSPSSLPQNKRLVIEKDGGRDWNQDDGEWTHDWVFKQKTPVGPAFFNGLRSLGFISGQLQEFLGKLEIIVQMN